MKLKLTIDPDIVAMMQAEIAAGERAVNKAAAGNDAAFAFKTGLSVRALIGLLGNDNFSFKVIHHDRKTLLSRQWLACDGVEELLPAIQFSVDKDRYRIFPCRPGVSHKLPHEGHALCPIRPDCLGPQL